MGFAANAQSFEWAVNTVQADFGYSRITATAVDGDGDIIMVGRFDMPTDFDPSPLNEVMLTSTGQDDIFIWKMSSDGQFMWVKQIGGALSQFVEDLALDADGNIYITGRMDGLTDFDPSENTFELNATGGVGAGDIYIAKYNTDGDLVWAQKIGAGSAQSGNGICVANDGSVYVTGQFFGTLIDFDNGPGEALLTATFGTVDMFIMKLTGDGIFQWAKRLSDQTNTNSQEYGKGVRSDASGNIYIHGQYSATSSVDFDPGPNEFDMTPIAGLLNTFVMKLTADGIFQWARQIDTNFTLAENAFALNASGDLILGGSFTGTVDADPGVGSVSLTSAGGTDIFISQWNTNGAHVWTRQIGGVDNDWATAVTLDANDFIFFTGGFQNTVDFDQGPGEFLLSDDSSYNDAFICKMDEDGIFEWALDFGGSNSYCTGAGVLIDMDENIIMAGTFYGSIDFDSSPDSETILTSMGTEDRCLVKLNSCSAPTTLGNIQGSTSVCAGESVTYTITDQNWAENYTWTKPASWTGSSITNSVTFTAGATGGNITVTATNQCGQISPASTLNINVTDINTAVTLSNNVLTSAQTAATWQWLDCNNNNQIIPGATGQSFTPTETGSYAVSITKNGCTETSDCVEVDVIGIEEHGAANEVNVYPNPAQDVLTVQSTTDLNRITLCDLSGKKVIDRTALQLTTLRLDLSTVRPGVYILTVEGTSGSEFRCKVMVE